MEDGKKESTSAATEVDRMKLYQFYEQNGFGPHSQATLEKIDSWCGMFSNKSVLKAMKISLDNNQRNWMYVEKLLTHWDKEDHHPFLIN